MKNLKIKVKDEKHSEEIQKALEVANSFDASVEVNPVYESTEDKILSHLEAINEKLTLIIKKIY